MQTILVFQICNGICRSVILLHIELCDVRLVWLPVNSSATLSRHFDRVLSAVEIFCNGSSIMGQRGGTVVRGSVDGNCSSISMPAAEQPRRDGMVGRDLLLIGLLQLMVKRKLDKSSKTRNFCVGS